MSAEDSSSSWGAAAIQAAKSSAPEKPVVEQRFSERVEKTTRWIPVIGRLWDCRSEHIREAFYEVLCVLLFSTLPLWFFPLIGNILFKTDLPLYQETVSGGELLIYAASLSGAMVYFIAKRYGSVDAQATGERILPMSISFPYGRLLIISSALICMFSAATFFIIKLQKYMIISVNSMETRDFIDTAGIEQTSWFLFLLSTLLFFCSVSFRNFLEDNPGFRNDSEDALLRDWEEIK